MTRTFKVLIGVVVVVFLVFVFAGSTGAAAEPQMVRVTLSDYQIQLSQFVVAPGKSVTLVLNNTGESPHQVEIAPWAGNASKTVVSPMLGARTTQVIQVTLDPGVYRIACVQTNHAEQGMVSALAANAPAPVSLPLPMDFVIPILGLVLGSALIIGDSLGLRLTHAS
jgi:uncharacterized cupredoxin-like copper-binding protein